MKLSLKLLAALVAVSLCFQASAATITVVNSNDNGAGSLRQALLDASDGDTIDFSVTGTILLPSGQLTVDKSVTISGPGANQLAVNGNAASRVFSISSGKTVTISGLTISGGKASGSGFPDNVGGGIFNRGTLTVSNSTISGNSVAPAGSVGGQGGGIFNFNDCNCSTNATLTVSNSTISGNSAASGGEGGGLGGGILNAGTATVTDSTISGNSANYGGAIYNQASNAFVGDARNVTVTVTNSTLSGNSATSNGGAILSAQSNGAGSSVTGTVTLTHSTISGNSAAFGAGGIYNSGATLTIGDAILKAGATGTNIGNDSGGTVTSLGYNLSSDNGGGFLTATGDQINTDPMLGPLADNGGPTFTHAIDCDSPAVDKGSNPSSLTYDQRGPGFDRTVGSATDVGAFELQTACNTAPTITAATGVTLPQDASVSNSSIATVNDAEDAENTLTVTVDGMASATTNGVTVSNIAVDASGNVTADIAATCGATSASFTLRVTDSGGLFDEDTLNVAVTPETTPPVISSVSVSPNLLKPPNHRLVLVTVSASVSDNCDPNPVCSIISVTSNEPDTGCGSGDKPNDIQNINGLTVQLRAERCGTGKTGRIYTITVQCTDASGNSSTRTTAVTVKK